MIKIFINTIFITVSLFGSDLFIQKGHYQLSYDNLKLPSNEKLGLFGTSYLYDFNNAYLGLGIYSAVSGKRGGFFTGGFEAGYKIGLIDHLSLDTGLFVGGGGGGAAPQGSGLMLRPHIGLLYKVFDYKIGIGLSKVKFPNGDINSNQLYVQFSIPFQAIHKKNTNSPMIIDDLENFMRKTKVKMGWSDTYFTLTMQKYIIPSGVKNTAKIPAKSNMSLIGFEYGKNFNKNIFGFIDTAGAASGDAGGYAEILGGIGYKKSFTSHFGGYAKISAGAAGGGKVATGGGLIHKESIGLYIALNKKVALNLGVGHIAAANGDFKATTLNFGFNYGLKSLTTGENLQPLIDYQSFGDYEVDIKFSNQIYLSSNSIRKNKADNSSLKLIGFKVDRFLDKNYFISGQALGAYSGNSGGYAVGLVGFGKRVPLREHIKLIAQMSLGAAGGGNVDSGSGLIYQPMIGLEYEINNSFALSTSFGKVKAIGGNLDTTVLDFGFSYKFKSID